MTEPVEVQMHESGNNTFQMYQSIGSITDEKAGGLEPLLKLYE